MTHTIFKHDAIDIADPSSMQEMCHMNFVIDLAHRGVSVAQRWSIGAWIPKVWGSILHGDSECFLCPKLVTRQKKHLSLFLYRAQNVLSFLFYYKNCMVDSKENDKFDQGIKGLKHCHMIIEWPLGQGNGKSGPRTADFARIYISCARLNWFVLTLCHQVIPFKGYGTFNTRKRESYCTQFSQTHKGWPPPRLPQTKYNYSFFESTNNIFINLRQKVIWNR